MSADGFDSALSKGGWTQESLTPPGSTMEIVLCRPADSTAKDVPLVVHLHGGAYTLGVAKDSFPTALWLGLAKKGTPLVVASVSYRLAPEHPAPAAQQDVEAALAYLSSAELAARFGYDPARVHIWGASAGAGLALVVGAAMCRGGSRKPRSLFLDCPMVDPGCDTPSYVRNAAAAQLAPVVWLRWAWPRYTGGRDATQARCDPLFAPHAAPGGLKGMEGVAVLVTTGKADPLHDEGIAVRDALLGAGAEVTHVDMRAGHCSGWFFDHANKALALARISALLRL